MLGASPLFHTKFINSKSIWLKDSGVALRNPRVMLSRPEAFLFLRLIMASMSSLVEKLLAKCVFGIVRLSALG